MCQRVQCNQCGKPTWVGCGAHVEQVLGDVPEQDRCHCSEEESEEEEVALEQPPASVPPSRKSWLSRLLGS